MLHNKKRIALQDSESKKKLATDQPSTNEENYIWLRKLTMLSFNTQSFLDLNRRIKFANCMLNWSYDLVCLCETWLTDDVTTSDDVFLENYDVYKKSELSQIAENGNNRIKNGNNRNRDIKISNINFSHWKWMTLSC